MCSFLNTTEFRNMAHSVSHQSTTLRNIQKIFSWTSRYTLMSGASHGSYMLIVIVKNETLWRKKRQNFHNAIANIYGMSVMFVWCRKLQLLKFKIDKIWWDRESLVIIPTINVLILVKLALNFIRSKFSDRLKFKYVSHSQKFSQSDLFEA